MINECEAVEWKEGLLKHFNVYISFSIYDSCTNCCYARLFFWNKEGRGGDFMAMDNNSAPASTSKNGGFLSCMQVQAAAHATHSTKSSSVVTNDAPVETSPTLPRVLKVANMADHQLPPRLSLQQSISPYVSPPYTQVPVTTTSKSVNTTTLDPISELSEIEPNEESRKPKSSVPKGKRKVMGQHSEGGPSKRRSGRKKAGNNA